MTTVGRSVPVEHPYRERAWCGPLQVLGLGRRQEEKHSLSKATLSRCCPIPQFDEQLQQLIDVTGNLGT